MRNICRCVPFLVIRWCVFNLSIFDWLACFVRPRVIRTDLLFVTHFLMNELFKVYWPVAACLKHLPFLTTRQCVKYRKQTQLWVGSNFRVDPLALPLFLNVEYSVFESAELLVVTETVQDSLGWDHHHMILLGLYGRVEKRIFDFNNEMKPLYFLYFKCPEWRQHSWCSSWLVQWRWPLVALFTLKPPMGPFHLCCGMGWVSVSVSVCEILIHHHPRAAETKAVNVLPNFVLHFYLSCKLHVCMWSRWQLL